MELIAMADPDFSRDWYVINDFTVMTFDRAIMTGCVISGVNVPTDGITSSWRSEPFILSIWRQMIRRRKDMFNAVMLTIVIELGGR